jgi:DNA recombination protein RmuC
MDEVLLWIVVVLAAVAVLVGVITLVRVWRKDAVGEELRAGREESRAAAKELREEVSRSLRETGESLSRTLEAEAKPQRIQLETMAKQLKETTEAGQKALELIRGTMDARLKELDEAMTKQLRELTESNRTDLDKVRRTLDERVQAMQEGNEKRLTEMRAELAAGLKSSSEALGTVLEGMGKAQQTQLESVAKQVKELVETNQSSLERMRTTFDSRVKELQEGNEKKLEEMRKTVDEKLHETLEKRLGESFQLVSDRLEAVHKGLGEMQSLASGVGDLKRVLMNVKARGTWAEVQLGAILEQVLTPDQFERNVCVKPQTMERVEYAIRLPGPKADPGACVWLPIDSKFPQEDYVRLQEAADRADAGATQAASDALARAVRVAAKDISDKYVDPPNTTDFGIMFLATEGLYAEVLRQPSLVEELQQRYRVVVAGPTTLAAVLSSLRMGFQTLAIEKRASEVWRVLGAVKTEFGKFGDVLDKVKKQLGTASRTLDETGRRSRQLEKSLRGVTELPALEAEEVLALSVGRVRAEELESDESEDES